MAAAVSTHEFEISGKKYKAIVSEMLPRGFSLGVEFPNGDIRVVRHPSASFDTEDAALHAARCFVDGLKPEFRSFGDHGELAG